MAKRSKKAHYAVFVLLFITIGAALTAFFWIGTVEKHIEYKDIVIDKVNYNLDSNDLKISLINGLSTKIPVRSSGSINERTVLTIYPKSGEAELDCDFVPLSELDCNDCDKDIESKGLTTLSLGGDRTRCLLSADLKNYKLSIFFGVERAPVSKEFSIK